MLNNLPGPQTKFVLIPITALDAVRGSWELDLSLSLVWSCVAFEMPPRGLRRDRFSQSNTFLELNGYRPAVQADRVQDLRKVGGVYMFSMRPRRGGLEKIAQNQDVYGYARELAAPEVVQTRADVSVSSPGLGSLVGRSKK